ncbi:MAG: PASTA domain-containing protein, partial [Gemmatimonadota bacterium]
KVIQAAGLTAGSEDSVSSGVAPGVVVATRPGPGASRPTGTAVDLVLSSGPPPTGVPSVRGMTLDDARRVLQQVGLSVGELTIQKRDGPAGVVLNQNPGTGARIVRGGRVDLVVSGREDS